jgi:hypothetical protein
MTRGPQTRASIGGEQPPDADLRAFVARTMMDVAVGDRLPTVRDLALMTGASLGSVQAAVSGLVGDGALETRRRGQLGTLLLARDLGLLWEACESSPMIVALPVSLTDIVQGLATGIKAQLGRVGIRSFSMFIAGAASRIEALHRGSCHLAVMSALGVDLVCGPEETTLLELPAGSYVEHSVVVRRGVERPERALVDRRSIDQEYLTQMEFGDTCELVTATSVQFPRLLERGVGDAAVWGSQEMPERLRDLMVQRPLSEATRERLGDRHRVATIVGMRRDSAVAAVAEEAFDAADLAGIQQATIDGHLIPEY